MRDSFVFYRSFLDGLNAIPKKDRLACYEAIVNYALNDKDESGEGVAAGVLNLVKPIIDANSRKAEAGRKGGQARASKAQAKSSKVQANSSKSQASASKAKLNRKEEIVNSKKEKEKEKEKETSTPKHPTVEQVKEYAAKAGLNLDAERFVDYYIANGWKVGGRTPMKDWQAAARNWARRDTQKPAKASKGFDYENQRNYSADDYAALERRLLAR